MNKSTTDIKKIHLLTLFILVTITSIPFIPCLAQNNVARVQITSDKKWYLINEIGEKLGQGNTHIKEFSEGLAACKVGFHWGYMDKTGTLILPAIYRSAGKFSCGIAPVSTIYGEYFYINKKGETAIEGIFKKALPCSDDMIIVRNIFEEGFKLYTKDGKESSNKFGYEKIRPFKNGIAPAILIDKKMHFINTKGEILLEGKFEELFQFSDGMAAFETILGWGYIDSTFKKSIPAFWEHAWPFSDGYARVKFKKGKSSNYLINKKGEVKDWQFKFIGNYKGGLVAARNKDKLWGYININGDTIIDFQFIEANDFSEGLALVKTKDKKIGYINQKGEWVIEPVFIDGRECKNGFVLAKSSNHKWAFYNKEGKQIGNETYIIMKPFENAGETVITEEVED